MILTRETFMRIAFPQVENNDTKNVIAPVGELHPTNVLTMNNIKYKVIVKDDEVELKEIN